MAKLNFILRVRSHNRTHHKIQGRISHLGKVKVFSTGLEATVAGWDKKRGNVSNNPEVREKLNDLMDYVEFDIIKEYKIRYKTFEDPSIEYICDKVLARMRPAEYPDPDNVQNIAITVEKDFADYMDEFAMANESNYRYDTLQVYVTCARYLRYFSKETGLSLEPKELNNSFFAQFVGFLTSGEVPKGTKFKYKGKEYEFANPKGKMINTTVEKYYNKISSTIKFFDLEDTIKIKRKKVMGGLIVASPDISEMPFLTYSELMDLYEFDCSIYLNSMLNYEAARDCFIFCAFTGLRHNELYDLTDSSIKVIKLPTERYSLSYVPEKNMMGVRKETLLPQICIDIINKWKKRRFQVRTKPKNSSSYIYYPDALLPVRGSQRFNECLRRLFKDVGWAQMKREYGNDLSETNYAHLEPVGFYKWEEKVRFSGKDRIVEKIRRYDHIKFHASRHSFAFWLLANNVSIEEISKLMNHEKLETTQKYYIHWKMNELVYKVSMKIAEQKGMLFSPFELKVG